MVDWNSPEIIQLSLLLFRQTAVFVLGGYSWYIVLTFKDVELRLLLGHIRFRIAHIPYILARYSNVCELLTIVLASYVPRTVHSCVSITWPMILTAVSGNVALAASSTNIAFRVIMLWWKDYRLVSHILIAVCIIDLTLAVLLGAFSIDSTWDAEHNICVISPGKTQRGLLSLYCFTVVWHIAILILTILGIRRFAIPRSSPLSSTIYHQSLHYAVFTCATCIPMAVFVYINLNSILNILPALIGTTITVMTSSYAVTSLFRLNDPPSSDSTPSPSTSPPPLHDHTHRNAHRARRFRRQLRTRLQPHNSHNRDGDGDRDREKSPTQRGDTGGVDDESEFEFIGMSDTDSEDVPAGALTTHINIGSTSEFCDSSEVVYPGPDPYPMAADQV